MSTLDETPPLRGGGEPWPSAAVDVRSRLRPAYAVVGAAMLGNMVSMNTVLVFSLGAFMGSLGHDFGWSRADISFSVTCFTAVVFLGSSLVGRLADRVDPGRLAAVSMLAFGLGLMVMPWLVHSLSTLWLGYTFLAVIGLGTSPVVLSKPVISLFSHRRGLAIGVALVGAGIGGFLAPQFATALIARGGWQLGYSGLGWCAVAVAPVLWFLLGNGSSTPGTRPVAARDELDGLTFGQAVRTRSLWQLSAVALLIGVGTSGPAVHLIPFLLEQAVPAGTAALVAALIGLGSIIGRLVTGFLLDRVASPRLALPLLGIGAAGIALLGSAGASYAAVCAGCLGFALGAQIDLLAYFTVRYFGLRAYSALFGWTYGMIALGASAGPVMVGAVRDSTGTYTPALFVCSGFMAAAAGLSLLLEPYRYGLPRAGSQKS